MTSMRVGINADFFDNPGGIGMYMRNVVRALGSVDPDGDYTLLFPPSAADAPLPGPTGTAAMHRVVVPLRNTLLRTTVTLPLAALRRRIDVLHVQYAAPPFCPAQVVVHVHDLIHEYHPEFYASSVMTKFRIMVPLTVHHAARVLTDSEYSKRDIMRRYCVPSDKVVVALGAADPIYQRVHDLARLAEARGRYGTGEEFILYVGNIERRKNLKTLIEAYVRLRQAGAIRAKLVLVGRAVWLADDIFAAARDSGYADELVFTDYVPEDDLVALYSAADLFVFPSLFEGFGIPVLEAMACGTPVICSNATSLPEVAGDAALMVDPLDVDALARSMATVLDDTALRATLSTKGLRRAAYFSWDDTARTIASVYREAAGQL